MARHLKQITDPLAAYLNERFPIRAPSAGPGARLAPALEVAHLQGEALLRQRFFAYLQQRHLEDPQNQLDLWQGFCGGAQVLRLCCDNSGLTRIFLRQAPEGYLRANSEDAVRLDAYCALLHDLRQRDQTQLLARLTDQLFSHYIAGIYPAEAAAPGEQELKRAIRGHLARQWNLRPEIRESYRTEENGVVFTLIAKTAGFHPLELITLQGNRLKPTRLAACRQLHEQLEGGLRIEAPRVRTPKKQQPIRPLG